MKSKVFEGLHPVNRFDLSALPSWTDGSEFDPGCRSMLKAFWAHILPPGVSQVDFDSKLPEHEEVHCTALFRGMCPCRGTEMVSPDKPSTTSPTNCQVQAHFRSPSTC